VSRSRNGPGATLVDDRADLRHPALGGATHRWAVENGGMTSSGYRPGEQGEPSRSNAGSAAGEHPLAQQLSELARDLEYEDSLQDTLDRIVHAAVDNVPGAQFAGISEVQDRREIRTPADTGEVVAEADRAQYETGQGPCLDSVYEEQTVRLPNMRTEKRWRAFTQRAADLGIGSMLSLQLYVIGDSLGALNLYNSSPDAFTDESEHVGLLFASHAAVAMAGAQKREQLNRAMETRDLIGQAKGILMERHRVTGAQAFTLLVRASQATNNKLRDVAAELVATGELRSPHRQRTTR
jgi:hypothetical protein